MAVLTTALQFIAGCLTLGLGLFLVAWVIRDLNRDGFLPLASARSMISLGSARTVTAFGGAFLLTAGAYAARLAVPL